MTITEFLEARISEDEALIADTPKNGDYYEVGRPFLGSAVIARLNAECAAKRVISGTYRAVEANRNAEGTVQWHEERALLTSVRALAAVYSSHPDYREEWKL